MRTRFPRMSFQAFVSTQQLERPMMSLQKRNKTKASGQCRPEAFLSSESLYKQFGDWSAIAGHL